MGDYIEKRKKGVGRVVVVCKFNHDFLSGRLIISIMAFASVYKYNNT